MVLSGFSILIYVAWPRSAHRAPMMVHGGLPILIYVAWPRSAQRAPMMVHGGLPILIYVASHVVRTELHDGPWWTSYTNLCGWAT